MKRIFFIIIWILFWLTLQSTILSEFPANAVRLDMIFIAVIAIGFSTDLWDGIAQVALIGLIVDALSPAPFGIVTFVYVVVFAGIRFATSTIFLDSLVARFLWTAIASVSVTLIEANIIALFFKNPAIIKLAMIRVLPQAIFSGIIGTLAIPFFQWYLNLSWEKISRPKGLVLR